MQRTITYLYPDELKASNLKVFQDRTNQIKGFYFTRDNWQEIERMESSKNYAIYFLFDKSEEGANKVYVGQSVNGIGRIERHVAEKDFWSFCILLVTDNNSFDKLTIDYLEYMFISKLKRSSYVLMNKDLRANEPNVSIYDKPYILSYYEQIEFLLNAEGINLKETEIDVEEEKHYKPNNNFMAELFVKNGKFVLTKGSEIRKPIDSSKNWKNDKFYYKYNSIVDDYLNDEKVKVANGKYILTINIAYDNPSLPANLVSGRSENGWRFFKGLNELRTMDNGGE